MERVKVRSVYCLTPRPAVVVVYALPVETLLTVTVKGLVVTVSANVVGWVMPPLLPWMVIVVGPPVVALAPAESVKVLVPPPTTDAGLKAAVTPDGRPEAAKVTLPVKPLSAVTVRVLVPLPPCAMLMPAGEAERPKSGAAGVAVASLEAGLCPPRLTAATV